MNTPTRDLLRRPDGNRRRSARQALAVIPDMAGLAVSPGEIITLDGNAIDNLANSRQGLESWSPAPSPDELVIQKRGRRRKTIVWSPDVDARKRDSLFSLSSRDRTPVKSPTKSNISLRSTPRKRLMLGDGNEQQLSTPEKQIMAPTESFKIEANKTEVVSCQKRNAVASLHGSLRGLSNEQLIKIILNLITLQEDGLMSTTEPLRDLVLKQIPTADTRPLGERLNYLRQNIYTSLLSSQMDAVSYSRAVIHLDAYQAALVSQGKLLVESQHWTAVMDYVFCSWAITKGLPRWENDAYNSTGRNCFKALACFCRAALERGLFQSYELDIYTNRLECMLNDCEDVRPCIELAKDKLSPTNK